MMHLARDPVFLAGLALRVLLLAIATPAAVDHWYAPFMAQSVAHPGLDPWGAHLAAGGDPRAFPYGYAMWLAFLPLAAAAALFGLPQSIGYGLTLLLVDLAMLAVLRRLAAIPDRKLLWLYWMSPVVLFASYWLGLNDTLPILLLLAGLVALRDRAPARAAIWMALGVSAKLSMVLALPFLLIYLFHNKRLTVYFLPFAVALAGALLLLQVPYFALMGGRAMLFGNPELAKVYDISFSVGQGHEVYLLPLVYLLVLFGAWRIRRTSFDLLVALLGIAFLMVLLLTPASPGWFLWVLPFLVLYQVRSDRVAVGLVAVFSLLFIGINGLLAPLPSLPFDAWPFGHRAVDLLALPARFLSLWQTLLLATGLILAARMLRQGIQVNEYFRLSRKPFVLGIAGDSGSGKDALAASIEGLFGRHSVVRVSGDDYHLWDRGKPMWQVMTHLHPRANELARLAHDVQALSDGRSVQVRHYDHATGKMSAAARLYSNDVIIVSGLHALSIPLLRELYDLRIYLDMDERLRRTLKVRRDVEQRGHEGGAVLKEIERREADAGQFVRPQAAWADLVLALQPVRADEEARADAPLRLRVWARQWLYYEDLVRILVSICGLRVDLEEEGADGSVALAIEGEVAHEDIALAARELLPELGELLDVEPAWEGGMRGLMQLVVLTHITQALRARLS
ncbi:MAG: uridine kinase [Burkholderiales bacterium]|nr:uridine kinase [Burkholderiales bacterium]